MAVVPPQLGARPYILVININNIDTSTENQCFIEQVLLEKFYLRSSLWWKMFIRRNNMLKRDLCHIFVLVVPVFLPQFCEVCDISWSICRCHNVYWLSWIVRYKYVQKMVIMHNYHQTQLQRKYKGVLYSRYIFAIYPLKMDSEQRRTKNKVNDDWRV